MLPVPQLTTSVANGDVSMEPTDRRAIPYSNISVKASSVGLFAIKPPSMN